MDTIDTIFEKLKNNIINADEARTQILKIKKHNENFIWIMGFSSGWLGALAAIIFYVLFW